MSLKYLGDKNKLLDFFQQQNWKIQENLGHISIKVTTNQGTIINWYEKKGTITFQGTPNEVDQSLLINFINKKVNDKSSSTIINNNIYIIHGHDIYAKHELENMLMKWGLKTKATINQASGGKTIIEAVLRDLKNCNFAVVLLTPDDCGYSKKDGPEKIQPRARQNVILELGFAIAQLGREKVLVLLKEHDIELPSDFNGVIYKKYTKLDEIKYDIRSELKNSGIEIKD